MSASLQRFTELKLGSARLPRRRRIWGLLTLAFPSVLAAIAAAMEPYQHPGGTFIEPGSIYPTWWRLTLMAGFFGSLAALVLWTIYNRTGAPLGLHDASVVVSDDELVVVRGEGQETVARSSIVNVFTDDDHVGVTLDDGRTLSFGSTSAAQRRALYRALEPDPARVPVVLPIGGAARAFAPIGMLTWWVYIVLLPVFVALVGATFEDLVAGARLMPFAAVVAALVGALWLSHRRREVVVGADGVRLKGTLFDTFVPHDAIERVTHFSDGKVIVHYATGQKLRLPPAPGNGALKERIEQARKLPRGNAPTVDALARDERSGRDWEQALSSLAEDRSYRAGALRIEDVEATLADPGAEPEARVGAAIALRARPDGPARIRIAAETTADADLQAALEAAAEGEVAERRLRKAQRRYDIRHGRS